MATAHYSSPKAFWRLLALTLALLAVMSMVGAPLNTPVAPAGIISFELAGTLDKARMILDSWDTRARLFAAFGLGFDYVFMLAYAALFSLAVRLAGVALACAHFPLAGVAGPLSHAQWLAAGLDALENVALAVLLLDAPAEPWPLIAAVCAETKFGLLFLGLVYAFYGLAVWGVGKIERK